MMIPANVDLGKEQEAALSRPPRKYGLMASLVFRGMDTFYGKELSWGKIRLLEILARIPYQAWEIRQYKKMNSRFTDPDAVAFAEDVVGWSREAQDSEFWHLRVVDEKIKQDNVQLHWFKDRVMPSITAFKYSIFSRILAFISIRTAFMLNADFEDHAEHEYMTFAKEHPELDEQPAMSEVITRYRGDLKTWGDVMRFIGLEERDHMNNSLRRLGRVSEIVPIMGDDR
ncbi:MAG TPA: hypothetical protein ENG86_06300 [Nitrospirae bacterium]|nr:hypothetical protein [Nitrospirota bacterium]